MSAAIMRFIVLGKVPGTDVEIGFGLFAFALGTAAAYILMRSGVHSVDQTVRRLNPLYRGSRSSRAYDVMSS